MKSSVTGSTQRLILGVSAAVSIAWSFTQPAARADPIPSGWQASNMKAIGYSGLDGRGGAFKMAIRRAADRWYLYMGHEWHRGWTILDVTDAANPKFVKFVPGPDNTNTIQMEFHGDIMLTALQRKQPNWGGDPNRPHDEGVLVWDIHDPVNWKQLSHWKTGATGVHRVGYPGGQVRQSLGEHARLSRADPRLSRRERSEKSQGSGTLVDARAERGRATGDERRLLPRPRDHQRGRQHGIRGIRAGGDDPRHPRRLEAETDRAARHQPALGRR